MSAAPVKNSNMAGIGGEADRNQRKAAALLEPAWSQAGLAAGLQVWRIEKFEVKAWPVSKHGKFYTGDSFIVLNSVEEKGQLKHHIFFWIGNESSIDEMGTAAYKTVELCDFFGGKPTQRREEQNKESAEFLALFPDMTYLPGGISSGFRQVVGDCFEVKLYQIRKTPKGVVEKEVTMSRKSLNQGDCFILDAGRLVYIWHGKSAHPLEKYEANAAAERIESRRRGQATATHVLDDKFWTLLGGKGPIKDASEATDEIAEPESGDGVLYKLTDETGKMVMFEVARGLLSKTMLDSDNVMILDRLCELCIWIGADASLGETRSALWATYNFLKTNSRDMTVPIHLYKEGQAIPHRVWNQIFEERTQKKRVWRRASQN